MPIDATPLRKVLKLECEKNYSNSAVIGGLDKFLAKWSANAEGAITDLKLLKRFNELRLNKFGYASLDRQQRVQYIDDILGFLSAAEKTVDKKVKAYAAATAILSHSKPKAKVEISMSSCSLDSPITIIKGISQTMAARFNKLGVGTVRDLLYFFPNRHLDYSLLKTISQLAEGKEETVIANIWQVREVRLGGKRSTEAIVGDDTGNVRAVWFNNPYLVKQLATNKQIVLSGRVVIYKGHPVFESPEWELLENRELTHAGRLVPIYPLTRGLYPRQVRKLLKGAIDRFSPVVSDFMPPPLKQRLKLLELSQAISQAHFPDDEATKVKARYRLAFDELFLLQLGVLNKKRRWQQDQPGTPFTMNDAVLDTFIGSLPFELTTAQRRVLEDVTTDLKNSKPMSRLLQGDVGSGKTVIAIAALLMAASNGCQGAFMAPTEILAEQHFSNTRRLLSAASREEKLGDCLYRYDSSLTQPLTIALLISDIKGSHKKEIQQLIQDGGIDIVIGTHALIQKDIAFNHLGLAVVDEQHRFGVIQRSALRQKGFNPHVLVMTATPIPRTLALTLYGDLDLSVIDELPPGRQEIKTRWLKPAQRESAHAFLRKQVAEGRQAFIICPLIEESEAVQAKAAIVEFEHLSRQVFPSLKLGLLHGRMPAAEKDDNMRRFRSCELDILVSTPVVEVGIDIPNATVMLIESADRFGLSQLHQFRGRVGRGQEKSYCLLLADNPSEVARSRLDIIEKVQEGFQLAEEDLKMRGPGEFFGTRQSGIPDLKMAKISDVALLELARKEAIGLFEKDPALQSPDNRLLAKEITRVWADGESEWS
ncbi:MAG TPA: ATP-dependent DNA helicase RecG [Dehalococcoidia bacterium]|nr:ATP-dependent DNA helicase RecG [Dehalococcoidia bacterium]